MDIKAPYKKEVANNIKKLLKQKDITQKQLSELSGVAKSTLSDYINEKTLPNPGNLQRIADALNVAKSEIDPRFSSQKTNKVIESDDPANFEDILNDPDFELFYYGAKELTEERKQELRNFIKFLKSQD
ncbi:MAG: helix-turn-helix transcriptional regulator [Bacillaceae bacterium]|nr:helix-turn-helix transcriptional regulator [Bacillaceae bacterium]